MPVREGSRNFCLSVTVDFPDDIVPGPYDQSRLNEMMSLIKAMGASRVNWIYYGDVNPDSYWAGSIFDSHWAIYGRQTLAKLGEPLQAAVQAARKHGLEIFGVLKPYYTGGSGTYPAGSPEAAFEGVERIGGQLQNVYPFITRHPDFRIKAKPYPRLEHLNSLPVSKIRLIKNNDEPTRIKTENLEIWTSSCNYHYEQVHVKFNLRETIEEADREVVDYFGKVVVRKGASVRVLTLEGLSLCEPYIVISTNFEEGAGDFRNTPLGMVEILGPGGEILPFVVATQNAGWIKPRKFRTYGLEFDAGYGHLPVTLDMSCCTEEVDHDMYRVFQGPDNAPVDPLLDRNETGGFIGVGRGLNKYLPSAPCEAYPEVQDLWMGWVERMLEAGVDGIDIRISGHSTLVDEPYQYGFNEPVLALYDEQFGKPVDEGYRLEGISKVRGDCFSEFMCNASSLVHSRGARFHAHIHTEYFRSNPVFGQVHGFPANVHFDWKKWIEAGWLDGITLRTSWYEGAEDAMGSNTRIGKMDAILTDPLVREVVDLADECKISVQLNRYVGRATGTDEYISDIEKVYRDERIAGLDVYEFFDLAHSDPNLENLVLVSDRYEKIRSKMNKLRIKK